ncbi:SRPBCC domain-containing protein [Jeotgalibaca caeni]|uniref:SRPBCC domain-containing protein n=1 Tax=Jeotgalibaca caeni TaxID=3028623 RepID=UPI00237DAFC2|nr:SRPBCC domain-containing protein [Jeotgalibaca caeni]MDE1549120.1 SRPBCC domain-containing protein [Jeotgalibaca caeni]
MGAIFIEGDTKAIWEALTQEEKLNKWFASGATFHIPELAEGEKVTVTLQPTKESQLTQNNTRTVMIDTIVPFQEISFIIEGDAKRYSFKLKEDATGTTVRVNASMFDQSLERLKTMIEKRNEL